MEQPEASQDTPAAGTNSLVWFNGTLMPESDVGVSPFDHGLLTGDGVFETLIAYGGVPFAFNRHWARLGRSASVFGLGLPEKDVIYEAANAVVKATGLDVARIRITVTGGRAPLGSEKGDDGENVIVAAATVPNHAAVAQVVTVPWPRNENGALRGIKTTSYGENVVALARAKANDATEAIFGNIAGNLCEGTGSNIFVVKEGRVITPTLESGCLAGVTRALAIELCQAEGIPVTEEDMPLENLESAPEAFLTSTLREIQPIEKVNGKMMAVVGGEEAARIAKAFRALVDGGTMEP